MNQAPAVSIRWRSARSRVTRFASLAKDISDAPGSLELVPSAYNPFPRQRQHDSVLAVLKRYGRRRGHQVLRSSRNALIIAPPCGCRANTMPSNGRKRSGEIQIKYESDTTSHGLRFATKASRIFFVRSAARKHHHQNRGPLSPPMPRTGIGGSCVGQTVKESALAKIAAPRFETQAPIGSFRAASPNIVAKSSAD